MGGPVGKEDPQEASCSRALCPLLSPCLHEGPAQPVHEETQPPTTPQQEQVRGGTYCQNTGLRGMVGVDSWFSSEGLCKKKLLKLNQG